VWCNDFGEFSLNILVYVFFTVPDWSTELRERERLFVDIILLADKLDVRFAFPTQTLHMYKEEHQPYRSQHDVPDASNDPAAQQRGASAAESITADQWWRDNRPGPMHFPRPKGPKRRDRELGGDG